MTVINMLSSSLSSMLTLLFDDDISLPHTRERMQSEAEQVTLMLCGQVFCRDLPLNVYEAVNMSQTQ